MLNIIKIALLWALCCPANAQVTRDTLIEDDPALRTATFESLPIDTTAEELEYGSSTFPTVGKKALVIGISDYEHESKLNAPIKDAQAMAKLLRDNGWQVQGYENLHARKSFEVVVNRFKQTLKPEDEVLVYYSGHGFQYAGKNYLVPKTAHFIPGVKVEKEAYPLENIIIALNQAKCRIKIILLDACRNNLTGKSKHIAGIGGLAEEKIISADIKPLRQRRGTNPELTTGTLVAYATAPGKPALDGRTYSIFTGALYGVLIKNPCSNLTEALQDARSEVVRKTKDQQVPWENSSLTGKVRIGKCER